MSANALPFTAKAELMVARGEAKNYSEACSLLAKRRSRKNYGRTTVSTDAAREAVETPKMRLPYADN